MSSRWHGRCRVFLASLALCGGLFAAQAEEFGTLRGIVHDPQHRPIADARVVLKGKTVPGSRTLVSNPEGEFEADHIAPGEYLVDVSAHGFRTSEESVTV